MKIIKNIEVPTGNILIVEGANGKLEMLSLGDYGKDVNMKADFLGLNKAPDKVRHTNLLPLEEKWVLTISTQYGCSMNCTFCDVPKVGKGKNATFNDLTNQVLMGITLHPEVTYSKRINIHYARMGEPTWNPAVLSSASWVYDNIQSSIFHIHPVVSTMMPKYNKQLKLFIEEWMRIKNDVYDGEAGLQLSINSTCEQERNVMFDNNAHSLKDIALIMDGIKPKGRKITLNFAVADYKIEPDKLLKYFSPENYIIKLTPMHKTLTALDNNIKTIGAYTEYYPYDNHEKALREAGYDVLVFIASEEEDLGRITCGNAILSGSMSECEYKVV